MNAVVQKLETVFGDIAATRMAGLPICNDALRVQAVGLREWQGHWLGVLVTPWTISLILMQGDEVPLQTLGADEKMSWEFPSGEYEFMGLNEAALGACQMCSLISPVADIGCHEDAVNIAGLVMEALFVKNDSDTNHGTDPKLTAETARLQSEPTSAESVSRRDFLRGNFFGNRV